MPLWTKDEDEYILANKNIKTYAEIAQVLSRGQDAVRNRAWKLTERLPKPDKPAPKIGIVDIETLPMEVYAWGCHEQNIGIEQIITPTCLLSWAGKFLNEAKVTSDILTPAEAPKKDAKRIIKSCWEFLSKCQVVIGHNIQQFDTKLMNTFFLEEGLLPLKYIQIDTLMIAKQNFRFDSNRMGHINRVLGIRQKIEHEGFPLWAKCHAGNRDALKRMREYNEGDIFANEDLFYRLRPFVKTFNFALFTEATTMQCPACGSQNVKEEDFYYTPAGKWLSVRCTKCGCLSRTKHNQFNADKKKSLLINS